MSELEDNPEGGSCPLPKKIEKILDGFRESKALFAACDFGIFDKLHKSSPQSAKKITEKMSSDLDATTRLLDTLVALEFLEKRKQGDQWLYTNSEMASKFLTTSSPQSQLGIISFMNKILYPLHGNLESAVLDGSMQWANAFGKSPEDVFREAIYSTEEDSLRFNKGMHSVSFSASYAVAKAVDLSAFNNCCDLGGKSDLKPLFLKILSFDIVLVGLRHLNLDYIQMNLKVFAWLAELKGHWSAGWGARITEEEGTEYYHWPSNSIY